MANAAEQFCALGFREVLRRTRRTRKPEAFPVETTAVPAKPEDFEDVSRFLSEHFSALTGCLPTADDLRENLATGHTVITRDEQGVSGVLHFAVSRVSTEIRHLAVRADCRGRGLACELLTAYPECDRRRKKSGMGADRQCSGRAFLRTTRLPARRMDFRRAAI